MFDNIGRDLDEEAAKRRATSLFLTTTACCATLGLILGIAAYKVVEQPPTEIVDEIVFLDPPAEELPDRELPTAPPPPVAQGEETAEPEPQVPDELVDEARALQDEIRDQVADAAPTQGTPDGDPNGVPEGIPGGTPGGDPDGEPCGGPGEPPCGGGGDGVQVFHHTQLKVARKVELRYPEAAKSLAIAEQRCLVTVFIGEDGVPYDVNVDKCPKVFHEETRAAMSKWRWYPVKDGKKRVRAQTTIAVVYRLD